MSELETLTEANAKLTEELNNNIVEHKENQSSLYSYSFSYKCLSKSIHLDNQRL